MQVISSITLAALMHGIAAAAPSATPPAGAASEAGALSVDARITLPDANGRIDHLAFDPSRQRLYVAELGSDSVAIVDVGNRRVLRTVSGFDEPQGIGYEPASDTVYVANGGDGSVRLFRGEDFSALGRIELGADADNVRVDEATHRVYVGFGGGALAVLDSATRRKLSELALDGHPESFQLDPGGDLIYVNVPQARHIAVLSRASQRQIAAWPTGTLRGNFPLALDAPRARVISVLRDPPRLQVFDMHGGRQLNGIDVCRDADDVFVDARRQRLYVTCGEGYVDVLDAASDVFTRIGRRVVTGPGSRTGLFVPQLDRLFVAVRASKEQPPAIWILQPVR